MSKKIKLVIGYPPLGSPKGTPLLSQNRQFQYFHAKTNIYPMVPAYAATNARIHGYEVKWMDGIAREQTIEAWLSELREYRADILMMESKSPVIRKHWAIIDQLKKEMPAMAIVLVGDHVTYDPSESFDNSQVDFVITGGDYDFVLPNLLDHIANQVPLEGGIWWRERDRRIQYKPKAVVIGKNKKKYANSGPTSLKHNLDTLPLIDRDLTQWKLYAYHNGNYKYTPGTYMYSGRDCWWNRCTFCIWDHTINPIGTYRRMSPERLFAEVKHVVDAYGVKEIFDDAGTFMVGPYLRAFCRLMIDSGYSKKVVYSCNMRLNALKQEEYDLMGQANFRFILFGMESANQKTLDKLHKGLRVHNIEVGVRMAKKAGLEPHLTVMLGYPWETHADAVRTIALARKCFHKGYVDTLQATIVIPYPGTPLWKECKEKGWLLTTNYEDYDMRKQIMKSTLTDSEMLQLTRELYSVFLTPTYIIRKISSVRNWSDVKYYFMALRRYFGHLSDFSPKIINL